MFRNSHSCGLLNLRVCKCKSRDASEKAAIGDALRAAQGEWVPGNNVILIYTVESAYCWFRLDFGRPDNFPSRFVSKFKFILGSRLSNEPHPILAPGKWSITCRTGEVPRPATGPDQAHAGPV
jgi:hypothetical protein